MNAARQFSNPFPGLRPFSMEEKYLFFGREEQTMELLSRLRRNRFLAVVGTSGSGKSSLVKAGLLPELYGGTMTSAGSNWEVVLMRPGGNPVSSLATALCGSGLLCGPEPSSEQEDLLPHVRATLNRSALGLVEAIRKSNLSALTNVLLLVDQFEEIFRFSQSKGGVAEDASVLHPLQPRVCHVADAGPP